MNANRLIRSVAQSDPSRNRAFLRGWVPEPFVSIGAAADSATRKLAIEATLRLIERAEACDSERDRRQLANAAAQILRSCNLTPADLPQVRAA